MTVSSQNFVEVSGGLFVDADYVQIFESMGLVSIESIFGFNDGEDLVKSNMAKFR